MVLRNAITHKDLEAEPLGVEQFETVDELISALHMRRAIDKWGNK